MAMQPDEIKAQLTEGTVLDGPYWTEPVKVLTAKARGSRAEIQAVGTHTERPWTELLEAGDCAFRIFADKPVWSQVLVEKMEHMDCDNFKSAVARFQGRVGADCEHTPREFWSVMYTVKN
jgi:hypothetical protein